ncbi:TPA: haloacid dehalogenase-like hydrolase, partial [bacterium]|nr:haloacid dehalogenase-like hydrolase [bacterium]
MDMRRRIAIIYDFDLTLIPKNIQEYGFIDSLNMSPDEFW